MVAGVRLCGRFGRPSHLTLSETLQDLGDTLRPIACKSSQELILAVVDALTDSPGGPAYSCRRQLVEQAMLADPVLNAAVRHVSPLSKGASHSLCPEPPAMADSGLEAHLGLT